MRRQLICILLLITVLLLHSKSALANNACLNLIQAYHQSIQNPQNLYSPRVIVTFRNQNPGISPLQERAQSMVAVERSIIQRLPSNKISQISSFRRLPSHIVEMKIGENLTEDDLVSSFGESVCEQIVAIEADIEIKLLSNPKDLTILNWGLQNIGQENGTVDADVDAPEAWPLVSTESSVIVAVLDTGVDYTHPDLAGRIDVNPLEPVNGIDDDGNGYIDDVSGMNFVACEQPMFFGGCQSYYQQPHPDPMDNHGHGTHVAGIIAAEKNNYGTIGVAPNVRILPIKILNGGGGGQMSDVLLALDYLLSQKAAGRNIRVINNSWGALLSCPIALTTAINNIHNSGMLFIAAAGNDAKNIENLNLMPGKCGKAIAVAAVDETGGLSSFSNYGSTTVKLAAPGARIYSTFLRTVLPYRSYATYSGTSMACPMVSGVAALAFAKNPDLTTDQIAALLETTSKRFPALQGKVRSNGIISAVNLLNFVGP